MDRKKSKYCFVLGLAVTMIIGACSSSNTVQTGSYKYLYDYENRNLHPEYVIYHFSTDSSTIFFRIPSDELLYARSSSQSPFLAKVKINCKMSSESGNDTTSVQFVDTANEQKGWLHGNFNIKMPENLWNVQIEFNDLTRNNSQLNYLVADKTTNTTGQNILIRNGLTAEPVFGSNVTTGELVTIESARNQKGVPPHVLLLDVDEKLPPPPFSTTKPEVPTIGTDYLKVSAIDGSARYSLTSEKKNYFITFDDNLNTGLLLRTSGIDFPAIKQSKSLEWPLRYITTKNEYEQIVKSTYPKKLIDNFWLECAGSKNRARDLIQIYYTRVEEANYYFSCHTDGWRTDRGMIHVIFGNPTKINKYSDREVWQYGEDNTTNQLVFVFNKEFSALSNNIYVLNRDPAFKQYWERMVTTWRNGRIYND